MSLAGFEDIFKNIMKDSDMRKDYIDSLCLGMNPDKKELLIDGLENSLEEFLENEIDVEIGD